MPTPKRSTPSVPTPTPKQVPPPLAIQPKQQASLELPPNPETIELSIRSTTRPIVGKPSVKNKVAKPLIGARSLVRTPGFNSLQLVVSESPTETN